MRNLKIVVAEDHPDIRSMMKFFLESHGYDVIEAANGQEAVEKVIETVPDLVLMDIAMPVVDGLEAAKLIRQRAHLADVPIIAITAYGEHLSDSARAAGCNDVIQKPLDFEDLRPLLQRFLP